ncbi:MAG: hypothetical protein ABIR78_02790 [Ferruginibacter sp.]
MKKKFLIYLTSLFTALLFLSSCQKETQLNTETPVANENSLQASKNDDDKPECQLKHLDYGTGYTLDFKYNNKGLASEVLLSYSDGYFERHAIFYDNKDRLIKTRIVSSDLTIIVFDFSHSGDLITRANGYYEDSHEPWRDIRYSYNHKGQMTKLDDIVQDVHMKYFYNNQGSNTYSELYFGTDLYLTTDLAFKIPNRNPFLAVNGLDFGFWDFFLPLWEQRWESYDRWVIYEEGSPVIILDTDPAKTTMITGPHNYLTADTKYDRISESYFTETMTYKNCGGHENENNNDAATPSGKQFKQLSPVAKLQRILNGPSKNIKKQLKDLKTQLRK